jgi:hypothetical protein
MTGQTKAERAEAEAIAIAAAVLKNDISHIKEDIGEIKEGFKRMEACYLTKAEFDPVKKVVYGMVTIILVAVIGAIVALVVV